MIIQSVSIEKFRAFEDIELDLGKKVTAIAGQNGTQKTTLLGIIAQPFSLKQKDSLLSEELTIEGHSFESHFSDKFKISDEFDIVGEHKFALNFHSGIHKDDIYECESISGKEKGRKERVRFWHKGRSKGSGYVQCPVIFLSLKRLNPIGEESLQSDRSAELSKEEIAFFHDWHNTILSVDDEFSEVANIKSKYKNTLAPISDYYSPSAISAGQDNVGKIILAILSFRRLHEKYGKSIYQGGLLLIDEIDSTLFPSSQEKLVEFLFHAATKYNVQIFFTTHSLTILKCMFRKEYIRDGKVIYLAKKSKKVVLVPDADYETIIHDLNLTVRPKKKTAKKRIRIYSEDAEARIFAHYLLKKYSTYTDWMKVSLGCSNYLELIRKKVPEFRENIIILDGDTTNTTSPPKNVLFLPSPSKSPEKLFYSFLKSLKDTDKFWEDVGSYTKQVCFKNHSSQPTNREKYKEWFNEQLEHWGRSGEKLFKYWESYSEENTQLAQQFRDKFKDVYFLLTKIEIID